MGFAGAMLGLTAISAANQLGQAYVQKAELNYNAKVAESEASLIQAEKEIDYAQYQRKKAETMGTSITNIAASGIAPQGSAMAAVITAQKNISIDQAISQFNFDQNKNYKLAEADSIRRQAKNAMYKGYTNAFSTILKGVSNFAMSSGFGSGGGGGTGTNKINTN